MSKLTFYDKDNKELFVDESFGNNKPMNIVIDSPTEIKYPYDFGMFVDSIRAQKKLQKSLGNSLAIEISKTDYKTIADVSFVSLEIKLQVGQGKIQKNILVPFICPIDINLADEIIQKVKED